MTGKLNLHTFYDHRTSSGGNIQLVNGAKIDLSGEDLLVKITASSDINNLPVDGYRLISSENGNNIDIDAVNAGRIILDSSAEQNQFVQWTLDANNMTLRPRDTSNEILRRRFSDASLEERQFIEQLSNLEPNSQSDAAIFKNQLGYVNADIVKKKKFVD
ncbi:MAG: hypothetical protein RCG15_05105 [Candidatus Rickettsia vulgarisii]